MEMISFIAAIISVIALIVFFVMSSNLGDIKQLARRQVRQNDDLIRLLNKLVNPNQKSIQEMIDAGEMVYLKHDETLFRIEKAGETVRYYGKRKGHKEFFTEPGRN